MILEKEIYGNTNSLFYNICNSISDIKTYHISPDYGKDLNTDNLQQYLKDGNFGSNYYSDNKYPICVCMTPRSKIISNGEVFTFNMFFLKRSFIDNKDLDTNNSSLNLDDDWSTMKQVCLLFLSGLSNSLNSEYSEGVLYRSFMGLVYDNIDIRRLSRFTNDNISGVSVNFMLNFNTKIC